MHKIGKILFVIFFTLTTPCIIKSMEKKDQKKLRKLINNENGPLGFFTYEADNEKPEKIDKQGNLISYGWLKTSKSGGKEVYVKVTAINKEGGWYRVEYAIPQPIKGEPKILPTGLFYWRTDNVIRPNLKDDKKSYEFSIDQGAYKKIRDDGTGKIMWDPKGKPIHPNERMAEKFINGSNAWHP